MQPTEAWLIKKINELVRDGVKNVNEMKPLLTFYIKNDILKYELYMTVLSLEEND